MRALSSNFQGWFLMDPWTGSSLRSSYSSRTNVEQNVKRDITFLGDVLNTTARIQSECNGMGVDILLSKRLLEKLNLPTNSFNPKNMGDILLRGKQEKVIIYTI